MLVRVVALTAFVAMATVHVCAAPSDGAAAVEPTGEGSQPVAPWLVLLKPEGAEAVPLLREDAGAVDPGPGQRYSWQSLTATLGFIAQALARIPIVWVTGNASATSLPPQRVSVEPLVLPAPTAAAASSPSTTAAAAAALDEWRDGDLPDAITAVDVDEDGISVAQVVEEDSELGEKFRNNIMEETLQSIANSMTPFSAFSGVYDASANSAAHADATSRAVDKRNVAFASEVHNTVHTNQPITNTFNIVESPPLSHRPHHGTQFPMEKHGEYVGVSNSKLKGTHGGFHVTNIGTRDPYRTAHAHSGCGGLAPCVQKYKSKIVKNTLDSIANGVMLFPNSVAGNNDAYSTYDITNAGHHTYLPHSPHSVPVVKGVPTNNVAVASEVYNTVQNSQPITNTFNLGHSYRSLASGDKSKDIGATNELSSCFQKYKSKILKKELNSGSNNEVVPTWFTGDFGGTSSAANVANAIAVDEGNANVGTFHTGAPVVKVVSPSHNTNDELNSWVDNLESNIVKQTNSITDSKVFPKFTFGNNAIHSADGTNTVAIDTDAVDTVRPVVKPAWSSSVLEDIKSYSNDGISSGNVANAVAVDEIASGEKDFHDLKSTSSFTKTNDGLDVNDGAFSTYGTENIANAVVIGKDIYVDEVAEGTKPTSSFKETKQQDYSSAALSTYGSVANAVAIDDGSDVDKEVVIYDKSKPTNSFTDDVEMDKPDTADYFSSNTANEANAFATDESTSGVNAADYVVESTNSFEKTHDEVGNSNDGGVYSYSTGNIASAVAIDEGVHDKDLVYDDSKFTSSFQETYDNVGNVDLADFSSFENVANAVAIDADVNDEDENKETSNSFKESFDDQSIADYSTYGNVANAVAIDGDAKDDKGVVVYDDTKVSSLPEESFYKVKNTDASDFLAYDIGNVANAVAIDGTADEDSEISTFKQTHDGIDFADGATDSAYNTGNGANVVAIDDDYDEESDYLKTTSTLKETDDDVGNVANAVSFNEDVSPSYQTLGSVTGNLESKNSYKTSTVGAANVANAFAVGDDGFNVDIGGPIFTAAPDYQLKGERPKTKIVEDTLHSFADGIIFPKWTAGAITSADTGPAGSANVANAVAIDGGATAAIGSARPVVEVVSPSHAQPVTGFVKAKGSDKGHLHAPGAWTNTPTTGLAGMIEGLKSNIVKQTLNSIANSITIPKWTFDDTATYYGHGTSDAANVANEVALDKDAVITNSPVVKTVRPFHFVNYHKLPAYTSYGNENIANAVAIDKGASDIKLNAFGSPHYLNQAASSYGTSNVASAEATDKGVKVDESSGLIGKTSFGIHPAYGSTHSANVANAVAIHKGASDTKLNTFGAPHYLNQAASFFGTSNVASAGATDKGVKGGESSGLIGKTSFGIHPAYGSTHSANVANAVAIDKGASDIKLNTFGAPHYLNQAASSFGTSNVASAGATDKGVKGDGFFGLFGKTPFGIHPVYGSTHSGNIANAVAIHKGESDTKLNAFGAPYYLNQAASSFGTSNVASVGATDKGVKVDGSFGLFGKTPFGIHPVYGSTHSGNVANAVAIDKYA